jgi:hypothetical protein
VKIADIIPMAPVSIFLNRRIIENVGNYSIPQQDIERAKIELRNEMQDLEDWHIEYTMDMSTHNELEDATDENEKRAIYDRQIENYSEYIIPNVANILLNKFDSGKIRCWRAITVSQDWTPPKDSKVGVYWSWDAKSAEAHWGSYGNGNVECVIEALIPIQLIDWVTTLVANSNPNFDDEREIKIADGSSVEIVSFEKWNRQ